MFMVDGINVLVTIINIATEVLAESFPCSNRLAKVKVNYVRQRFRLGRHRLGQRS